MNPYDNGKRTAPKVPGMNAQALLPSIGTDHWRTSNRNGPLAHRGSSHSKRFGVKPTGGGVADIWTGRPEVSPGEYIAEALTLAQRDGTHGRCHRLIEAAVKGDGERGPKRAALMAECEAVAEFGGNSADIAAAVSAALGF